MPADHRQKFGKYVVLGLLGQGGMARVYLSLSSGPSGVNKLLVIKELKDELAAEPGAREMFLDEARIASRLNHPNVVQTYEVGDEPEGMYLTMEYLEGQPLQAVLGARARGVPVPTNLLLRVLADTLSGLQYAHDLRDYDGTPLNVVHRDVSPHNIFVTYEGTVKLVDFGVAKAADASTQTASGLFKGKVRYSAPEQATGNPVDRRADLFAMGVILWEILAGRRMWNKDNDASILLRLVKNELPSLREANPEVSPTLEAICHRALKGDPDERFSSAEEMREELLAYLESQSSGATPDLGRWLREAFVQERSAARTLVEAQMRSFREDASRSHLRPQLASLADMSRSQSAATELVAERSASISRPPAGGAKKWLAVAATGGALVALVAVTLNRTGGAAEARRAAASTVMLEAKPETRVEAKVEALPLSSDVRVRLRVEPKEAVLAIDGVALGQNPYDALRPRDLGGTHVLTVKASGFADRSIPLGLDRDVDLNVVLAPLAKPAPPTVQVSAPRTSTPPRANPSGRAGPRRTIDEDDPYHR